MVAYTGNGTTMVLRFPFDRCMIDCIGLIQGRRLDPVRKGLSSPATREPGLRAKIALSMRERQF